ncbi:hypothetical protein PAP18089_01775 [Pandoraea apista]|uniref:Uncharacterized protein n=1 Tax=Pandoraea apista TaxID=93218 RepID=A0A5E5P4S2_9BURK|nr:hypothetical protein LMG16407_00919 [Pandoraea apista]VVG70809.1 hypothetical protein PAP18089_01775 [Pandoraea apista]
MCRAAWWIGRNHAADTTGLLPVKPRGNPTTGRGSHGTHAAFRGIFRLFATGQRPACHFRPPPDTRKHDGTKPEGSPCPIW